MRFAFDEDHVLFRTTVRDFFAKECTPAAVREAWSSHRGWSTERWTKLAALGVTGLTVPESHGGLGMDELSLVLVLEESGRAGLPEPIVDTTAVGAPLLAEVGSDDLRERWLRPVAAGQAILGVGLAGYPYVDHAGSADLLLLQRGDEVHAVAPDQVTMFEQPSLDGARRLATVEWEPRVGTRLADGERAAAAVESALDRGALATAAQLLGVSQQLINLAVQHARHRVQFGQPIGAFQAVKHMLADALLRLELARPVVYRAAYSVARDEPERALDVSMAKAYASDAATLASRVALQTHGAIGYTWEHDLHLWMKRGWALAASWGDAAWHRARVGAAVLPVP
ncbi:MAG TPA: acyl-CoA dehydrogenase family protein [Acidimicrobiales bacterium]|nr:acyl-CoA dehydrogenase family protein [Acidimicrobiales bacterium]